MKKIVFHPATLLVALVLFTLSACTPAPASGSETSDPIIPSVTTDTGWFIDTTGRVNPETIRLLNAEAEAIDREGFQMAGVIFSNSVSDGIEIATEFGNQNGIGYAEEDNGITLAVFLDRDGLDGNPPDIAVAIGSGLEGLLNDAKVGRFLDLTYVPARASGNWEQGLLEFVSMTHRYLLDPNAEEFKAQDAAAEAEGKRIMSLLFWGLVAFVVVMIILAYIDQKYWGGALGKALAESQSRNTGTHGRTNTTLGRGGNFRGGGTRR